MKNGKICFIHFRNVAPGADMPLSKGGATVAWRVNPDSGDIEIGHPAVCSPADNYIKSVGRNIAELNLSTKPLAISVLAADYTKSLGQELAYNLAFPVLTPALIAALQDTAARFLADGVFDTVSSTWFEGVVRNVVKFHEGKVYTFNGKAFGSNVKAA